MKLKRVIIFFSFLQKKFNLIPVFIFHFQEIQIEKRNEHYISYPKVLSTKRQKTNFSFLFLNKYISISNVYVNLTINHFIIFCVCYIAKVIHNNNKKSYKKQTNPFHNNNLIVQKRNNQIFSIPTNFSNNNKKKKKDQSIQ